jgi:hypothetical protein
MDLMAVGLMAINVTRKRASNIPAFMILRGNVAAVMIMVI